MFKYWQNSGRGEKRAEKPVFRCFALLMSSFVFVACSKPLKTETPKTNDIGVSNEQKPNVVWVISDDQAFGDFGFMGHPIVKTPNIDKLASQSLLYKNGYVPTSLCRASLMTLLTGKYTYQHKITFNDPPNKDRQARRVADKFLAQDYSVARLLSTAGYKSLQTGKFWEGNYKNGGFTHGMTTGVRHGDEGLQIGRKTMQPIVDFIDAAGDDPFFIWYAPYLPHEPHNAEEKYQAIYSDMGLHHKVQRYYANITWFDDTVGELMKILEQKGQAENTIIMFIVDNGWSPIIDAPYWTDYQGRKLKFHDRSKSTPYENGLRTPVFVWWPDKIKPQAHVDFVSAIDFLPTTLKIAGVKTPEDLPGLDIVTPKLAGRALNRDAVYGSLYYHDAVELGNSVANLTHRWVREGDWKLIVNEIENTRELYNLKHDPLEQENKAELENRFSAKINHLENKLNKWWNPRR